MTTLGYLTINATTAAMERRSVPPSIGHPSSAAGVRVITDNVESEETSGSRSQYSSQSTMSSGYSSGTTTTSLEDRGDHADARPPQHPQHAPLEQQLPTQQEKEQPQRQPPPSQLLRRRALRDGEITATTTSPLQSTAVIRRKPLHQTLGENSDDDFEVALTWHRNKRILLGRLVETTPNGRLSLINLCRRGIGFKEAILIKEAIIANQQLSVIKLSYNDLRDAGARTIAEAISANGVHHASLSSLDLGFNSIGDEGCQSLAVNALAGNYVLNTLYLSGNKIREKGALSIAGAILHGSALTNLHLTANAVGSIGLKAVAGAIAQVDARVRAQQQSPQPPQDQANEGRKSVQKLFVDCTGFDEAGFVSIPGMLLTNTAITTLCLSNNKINDHGMTLLSQALSQNKNVPIETLELSFNEITDHGLEFLMNSIWGSPTLKKLKIDNNRIQDRGAQLCAVVLTAVPLQVLDISYNRVTTVGIRAIMKNVSENEHLSSFAMSGIPVDQNSSKAISYALAYNSSLSVLRMDNCSAGYSAQRHIVAGMVSNSRGSLRVFTGFYIAPIAMTLGMPKLPESWSNEQVLGFVRLMWQQWLVKSSRGNPQELNSVAKGPAPPAAVAAAAKIAFTALGTNPEQIFFSEEYSRPVAEVSPIDPASSALMERTVSGTLAIPELLESSEGGDLHEWFEGDKQMTSSTSGESSALIRSPLEDMETRNRNLQWLRLHFRSLNQIGRLPFNHADLWQLHQYYFSPPMASDDEGGDDSDGSGTSAPSGNPHVARPAEDSAMGRSLSFSALTAASTVVGSSSLSSSVSNHSSTHAVHKRTHDDMEEHQEPVSKKAKSLKPRVAFYPRIMSKIQTLGSKPTEQMLGLLRQLKYTESAMFGGNDPYDEAPHSIVTRGDVEMILLDLF